MSRISIFWVVGLAAVAVLAPVQAQDVWKGKHRDDVMALLGEPDKTKKARAGSSVMVYKLVRVGDDAVPGPSFRVLDLPGVGRVGRMLKNQEPQVTETITVGPSGIDEKGRPGAGGFSRTETTSVSWDPATGERTGPDPPEKGSRSGGKVRLEITLDGEGIVTDWSATAK